jgi:hypothetical protein
MKIKIIGTQPKRINIINKPRRRVDPQEFGAALGARPAKLRATKQVDLIDLAEIGCRLIRETHDSLPSEQDNGKNQ